MNNRGMRINSKFMGDWNSRPAEFCKAARDRAISCINDPNPKLTALERAFYNAIKGIKS